MKDEAFRYRIAYGCWLNDSRTEPIVDESWPSIRIDEHTLSSLDATMAFLKECGYNYFDVFGLLTNNNWTEDIVSTVDEERKALVRSVIDIVHSHGISLIYGLGVYSWGFDDIITKNPAVRGTSSQAMCASSVEAQQIMFKVVDFVIDEFAVDGFHLEAADQGRCQCSTCRQYEDVEYYNRINIIVANYIRSKDPKKVLLMNTSGYLAWGDTFSKEQLQSLIPLCNAIDVFIDVGSHGHFIDTSDRKEFIKSIDTSFGTANGFWVYPPQRWDRLRWFLPHVQHNMKHIQKVREDGGSSCELYLSPLINPGVEITVLCNGLRMLESSLSDDEILTEGVSRLYGQLSPEDQNLVSFVFKKAENIFFSSYTPQRNRKLQERYSDAVEDLFIWSKERAELATPGEIFMEPLFGVGPGYPCYLSVHFDAQGRKTYLKGMMELLSVSLELAQRNPQCIRIHRITQSIGSVIEDIQQVIKDLDYPLPKRE